MTVHEIPSHPDSSKKAIQEILEEAKGLDWETVMVIGWDKEGEYLKLHSLMTSMEQNWLFDIMKADNMEGEE